MSTMHLFLAITAILVAVAAEVTLIMVFAHA